MLYDYNKCRGMHKIEIHRYSHTFATLMSCHIQTVLFML